MARRAGRLLLYLRGRLPSLFKPIDKAHFSQLGVQFVRHACSQVADIFSYLMRAFAPQPRPRSPPSGATAGASLRRLGRPRGAGTLQQYYAPW